ncbi:hypothetical protein NC653_032175 [Populus alba x Populus x berolinensis]|uniref:Uncharacterized protein n=1 Tax=Populus alba x Populus x berolinensis TaxID=444605 RepID=A0AAD6LQX3_9ROSI|nr:hypothetical protein NC653_032175 [Populus alba x Populus x berolinensis]
MGSIAIRTISKRFLHGNLMRQTCIRNTESLSPRHHSSKTRVSYTLYKPSPSHPFSTSPPRPSRSNSKSKSGFIGWAITASLVQFYEKVLPKRDVLTTFKKVFMGQAVYGPANATLFSPIMQLYKGILCFFPPQGYREAVIGHFFIISYLYKSVEATPEPSSRYQCPCSDQFGLMVGIHLFDTSESLALSWMLLAADILCAS